MKNISNVSILGLDKKPLQTMDEGEKRDLKVSDILITHATNVDAKGKKAVVALSAAMSVYEQADDETIELEDAQFDALYEEIENKADKKFFQPPALIYGRVSEVLSKAKQE